MKLMSTTAAVLLAALITACGGGTMSKTDQAANLDDATTAAPAATAQRQPGSWRIVHETVAFDGTNVAGGMADMVKAGKSSIGKKDIGGPVCLTAAQASKDDLTARLQEITQFGPEWKVVRSTLTNGKVDFLATMNDPAQGKGEMSITGRISPTRTDLTLTTDSYQPAPGKGHIHTVMKQENTRVGDCTPDEDTWSG